MNKLSTSVEDLALELGGTVRYPDGKVFNAAGRSGVTRLPPPRPVQEVAPPPAPDRTAEILQRVVTLLERPVAMPEQLPPTVVVQSPPPPAPKKWEFDITYTNGRLSKITATQTT